MRNHKSDFSQQREREKALYLYIRAFESGESDKMGTILQQAMFDPLLEEMIMDVHDQYLLEEKVTLSEEHVAKIRGLVTHYLPSGIPDEDEAIAIPPLTIGDVFDKLQEDRRVQGNTKQEILQIRAKIARIDHPLPENLALKNVAHLFTQLGIAVSSRLQKLFRDQAIFLSMTRQQGIAQLAATRRQKVQHQRKQTEKED